MTVLESMTESAEKWLISHGVNEPSRVYVLSSLLAEFCLYQMGNPEQTADVVEVRKGDK